MHSLDEALLRVTRARDGWMADRGLRERMEADLDAMREARPDAEAEVGDGFLIYRAAKQGLFLSTIHNGSWEPKGVAWQVPEEARREHDDLRTGELYAPLFHEHGGAWLTVHVSRSVADLNRRLDRALYTWQGAPIATIDEERLGEARDFYRSVYTSAKRHLPATFHFAGHAMSDGDRPDCCVITEYEERGVPWRRALEDRGFETRINDPFRYAGGHFRVWADGYAADSLEFEINKRCYLDGREKSEAFTDTQARLVKALSHNIASPESRRGSHSPS